MRKIDKSQRRSTEYQNWEASRGEEHPRYTSSTNPFYIDIVMDLLHCQRGLCAYSETQLCDPQFFREDQWVEGRYVGTGNRRVHNGQLEHFDEQLKFKEGDANSQKQDWLWSNFFMADSDLNILKGTKKVDYLLKPDAADYDPFDLLEYSDETHQYIPHPKFKENDPQKWARVDAMIEVLGLNFPNLVSKRCKKIPKAIEFGVAVIEPEFPTAFEFCRRKTEVR